MDTRYRFQRGSKVLIIDGPYQGLEGIVDSCVSLQGTERAPGYHVTLDDERWVTVVWNVLEETTKGLLDQGVGAKETELQQLREAYSRFLKQAALVGQQAI